MQQEPSRSLSDTAQKSNFRKPPTKSSGALLIGAVVAYSIVVLAQFVILPLSRLDGLFFYFYNGLGAVLVLFSPLVGLLLALRVRPIWQPTAGLSAALMVVSLIKQAGFYWATHSYISAAITGLAIALTLSALLSVHPRKAGMHQSAARFLDSVDEQARMMRLRRRGAIVLALAAIAVVFGLAPRDAASSDVAAVMVSDTMNQDRAKGAPQQSVVNGWTARDLLQIIATQGTDHRPAALLTLAVLGLALGLFTSSPNGTRSTIPGSSSTVALQSGILRDSATEPEDLPALR